MEINQYLKLVYILGHNCFRRKVLRCQVLQFLMWRRCHLGVLALALSLQGVLTIDGGREDAPGGSWGWRDDSSSARLTWIRLG